MQEGFDAAEAEAANQFRCAFRFGNRSGCAHILAGTRRFG